MDPLQAFAVFNAEVRPLKIGIHRDLRARCPGVSRTQRRRANHPGAERALAFANSWVLLTTVLNELARSMWEPDFYPIVMPRAVLRKLHFIRLVIKDEKAYAIAR